MNEESERTQQKGFRIVRVFLVYLYGTGQFVLIFGSIGVLVYQCFGFLLAGEWTPLPLVNLVGYLPEGFSSWYYQPDSWYGVHKIVRWFLETVGYSGGLALTVPLYAAFFQPEDF